MPHAAKFAASARALTLHEPAEAGIHEVRGDTASHTPEEVRPLTLHFSSSSVAFRTSIPKQGRSGDELDVAQLRDILLNRGLLSSAEHVAFFEAAPAAQSGAAVPRPLEGGHRISTEAVWVLQEARR